MIIKTFLLFIFSFIFFPVVFAGSADFFTTEAVRKSLHKKRYWNILLHYKENLFGGKESEQDSPLFFNSPEGKTNPKKELISTIESFFSPPEYRDEVFQIHPRCRFPARYEWLRKELETEKQKFPEIPCPALEEWKKNLDPEKAVLIFPSARVNIPASMFGHTLLRIDKKNRKGGPLLNYVINFGAEVDTNKESSIKYIFLGIFGGYYGSFSIVPYYIKVQEYNEFEQRDLWEYDLNFSQEELDRLMLHFWELRFAKFDYFFFRENCSYQILSLIEIAKPELNLQEEFVIATIPADSIRAVNRTPDLLKKPVYRMSRLHQFELNKDRASEEEIESFVDFVNGDVNLDSPEFQKFSKESQATILDLYLDYLIITRDDYTDEEFVAKRKPFLRYRSKLKIRRQPVQEYRFSEPPELGHKTKKVQFGFGANSEEDSFGEISFRMAIHDLLDFDRGYDPFAEIQFFHFNLRYYEKAEWVLDEANFIEVKNLNTRNPLPRTPSIVWEAGFRAETAKDIQEYEETVFTAYANGGWGYRFGWLNAYALLGGIQKNGEAYRDNYRTGISPSLLFHGKLTKHLKSMLEYKYIDFFSGDTGSQNEVSLKFSFATPDYDIRLEGSLQNSYREVKLDFGYYF